MQLQELRYGVLITVSLPLYCILLFWSGLKKLFSGGGNPDLSPLSPKWEQISLDTLQHKTILKVLTFSAKR